MSDTKIIGKIFESNSDGKFIVEREAIIAGVDNSKSSLPTKVFVIRFLNTNSIAFASYDALRHGRVKDKFKPDIAGLGYIGYGNRNTPIGNILYSSWNDMMHRCYNKKDSSYKNYGLEGVSIDPSWYNYSTYAFDVSILPNFDKKLRYPDIYQLDKDYLQLHLPKSQRIYSKNTCMWLSSYDNIMIMNREQDSSSGYYGVSFKDNSWNTRINNFIYGRFDIPEAAACLFNYIYPTTRNEFNNISILNDVPNMSIDELKSHAIYKQYWIDEFGSTTIPLCGVGLK